MQAANRLPPTGLAAGTPIDFSGLPALEDPENNPPRLWKFLLAAALTITILLVGCFSLVDELVTERHQSTIQQLEDRLDVEVNGKLETLSAWLDGLAARGNRIVRSELVALFAAESILAQNDTELARALDEQRPYMRTVFNDLAADHDLHGVYLLDAAGNVILQDRDAPLLKDDYGITPASGQSAPMSRTFNVRHDKDRLIIDVLQPLQGHAGLDIGQSHQIAALLISADMTNFLRSWLDLKGQWREAEQLSLWLIEPAATTAAAKGYELLEASIGPAGAELEEGDGFRLSQDGLFKHTASVDETGWRLMLSVPSAIILAPIDEFAETVNTLALAIALALAAGLIAAFWHQTAAHHKRIANQYRQLASRIFQQASMLDAVMQATSDLIVLNSHSSGDVLFGNKALKHALKLPDQGWNQSPQLHDFLKPIASAGNDRTVGVDLGRGKRFFHIERCDVNTGNSDPDELIVARDMTDLVERQERHEQLLEQTVRSLARAIELVDPYLEGHSSRVESLCVRLAYRLGLNESDRNTLIRAAALSQFGKIFIPKSITAKKSRHSKAEEEIMRTHVDHALSVLGTIDFGAPVAQTIVQMHERLDGSGYPLGQRDDEIGLLARILAVSDVFCARTWPRSYRASKSQDEVCSILEEQYQRYDLAVVTLLKSLVAAGELLDLSPGKKGKVASLETDAPV